MEMIVAVVLAVIVVAWFSGMLSRITNSLERIEQHLARLSDRDNETPLR